MEELYNDPINNCFLCVFFDFLKILCALIRKVNTNKYYAYKLLLFISNQFLNQNESSNDRRKFSNARPFFITCLISHQIFGKINFLLSAIRQNFYRQTFLKTKSF